MKILDQPLPGILVLEPKIWNDDRGYFYESFSSEFFKNLNINLDFVQDNQSFSHKGALRGLHFQNPPFAQGKLIRVIRGRVLDVVVDIRKGSPYYGKNFSLELSGKNHLQMWISPGFAHGFETLEDDTIFCYKCTNGYNKESEGGIFWNDESLDINWKTENPIVSEKDQDLPLLNTLNSQFTYS